MDQSLLPNIYDFISHTYPFSQLNTLEQDAVATAIKISYHSVDDELNNENLTGAGLYMIRAGIVEEINKTDNSLRARLSVGDSFGYTQIDKEGESDYKVIFVENTLLYFIPKQVLQFLLVKNQAVGNYFNAKEWVRLSSSHQYIDEQSDNSTFSSPIHNEKTVGQACDHDVVTIEDSDTIVSAAQIIDNSDAEVAIVTKERDIVGIVSKSDITHAVATEVNLNSPVLSIMSSDVVNIDADEPIISALELMIMHNVKCLPVLKNDKLAGILTTHNLMQNSQLQSVYLLQEINMARSVDKLAALSRQNAEIFSTLVESNIQPHTIQRVMSRIADNFTTKLLKFGEELYGKPPFSYAWIAAGSLARNELQFLSDQDNAMILSRDPDSKESLYFKNLSTFVCQGLSKCGYPLCDGNYMASNDKWRVSYNQWTAYFNDWISNTDKESILNSQVFLDIRHISGDRDLVTKLQQHLQIQISQNNRFLATLCAISCAVFPPLGTFRQFVLTRDGKNNAFLNIKKQAINLIVELGRLYGLSAGCCSCDTYQRLKAAANAKGLLKKDDYRELSEAYTFLNGVRCNHQAKSLRDGTQMSNNIDPKKLSQFERNHLRDAFRIIARHQAGAKFHFASGMGLF